MDKKTDVLCGTLCISKSKYQTTINGLNSEEFILAHLKEMSEGFGYLSGKNGKG